MAQKSIDNMKPGDILKKESFRRALPLPYDSERKGSSGDYLVNANIASIKYSYPTQDDFLREFDPHGHAINSVKYYPNLLFRDDANPARYKMKVRSRVSVAWQKRIHTKRLVALTGFDPDISIARNKTGKEAQDILSKFKEGWCIKDMDCGVHKAISSDLKVGDVAFVGYKEKGTFGYRIFAYDKGDTLFPHYDPLTGEVVVFGRSFVTSVIDENGLMTTETYLDVWDDTNYIQYKRNDTAAIEGEDVWSVSVQPKPHNFPFCPVSYHRYGGPCWSDSQSLIEQHELSMSQLAENNAQYALRILYALGAEFEMEGSLDGTPSQINSTDPNAKVGFLEPADASESFKLQIDKLEKDIMRCSFAVETPEITAGSNIKALAAKMMMADSYEKALDDSKEYQDFLDRITEIFIEGYGTESQLRSQFLDLQVKVKLQPWVFLAESEVVSTVVQLVAAGVLSKQSATEYIYEALGLGTVDEAERLFQEEREALLGEQQKTEAEVLEAQTNNPVNLARRLRAESAQ